ncbi:MAG: PSP1 domain-containing protein [Candidatus Fimenecus sp.]
MIEIIGVNFSRGGKVYYFDPADKKYNLGDYIVVETKKGTEYAQVVIENRLVEESSVIMPLKPVKEIADPEKVKNYEKNREFEPQAKKTCEQKIKEHGLDMNLIDAQYAYDGNKIIFYYTAPGRVDFRELVKDLAGTFKMRIELFQVGEREKARIVGGYGVCGRQYCCKTFLKSFATVNLKSAKLQGLAYNNEKLTGPCGRLMCCLKFEEPVYNTLKKVMPPINSIVETPEGKGKVTGQKLLQNELTIKLFSRDEGAAPVVFNTRDIKLISRPDENNS